MSDSQKQLAWALKRLAQSQNSKLDTLRLASSMQGHDPAAPVQHQLGGLCSRMGFERPQWLPQPDAAHLPALAWTAEHGWVVVLAAVFCLVGGIAAPWLLPLVSGAFPVQAQVSSVVSQPMIALLLIACPLLPFLLMIFFKGDRLAARSRGAAWVCGYDHEQSMVVTAHGFAMPVKEAFAPLLKLRHWLNPVRLVPGWQSASAPALLRGMALVELAVLVVIVISRGA